ncbi:hypothetical protein N8I77_009409 [Diaporthe amygdali]|uniref:Zn(2)-C6 fungal-type domain-containing protein n=1 Tax=Phomopsis amygdali TaxID=1214568 RepID=A0AAD9SA39_PHOAM|nr:hypothetical protein N8I77_009409 [Diaporthe amygdali]
MPDEAAQPIHKRRRVTVACDSCRSKKSKCDGRRPVCSRCAGYDFICTWNERECDRSAARRSSKTPASSYGPPQYNSFHQCQHLVRQLCDGLSEGAMAEVEESLALIQTHLDQAASQGTTNSTKQHQITYSSSNSPQRHAPRYLGEVSDIQFFNLAKRTLGDVGSSPEEVEEVVDSYDQEEAIPARQMRYELSVLPDPVKAEEYLEAYFTTIHIAYPFVPKASFMRTYRSLRSGGDVDSLSPAWLGLLYLATVKKGRDHFDSVSELPEIRRRVWYSLYVLDRLLALQLGRPPAVSDEECYVSLPSVVDDMNHDWETEPLPTVSNGEKSVGEYFLENTRNLDEILLAWKQRLPRYLRFDVGHAFEKSMIFKRQSTNSTV